MISIRFSRHPLQEFLVATWGARRQWHGSVALGHAYPAIFAAAIREMRRGANFTRPSALEGECAEHLLEFVPGTEMAKFTQDGSTATTAAVRLARAYTGRDMVVLCADHSFYYDDWARQSVRHRWMRAYRGKQVVRR
jgi:glutamate-1-semialdehyde aminotransferase